MLLPRADTPDGNHLQVGVATSLEGGSKVPIEPKLHVESRTHPKISAVVSMSALALTELASETQPAMTESQQTTTGDIEVELSYDKCNESRVSRRAIQRRREAFPDGRFAVIDSIVTCETTRITMLTEPPNALKQALQIRAAQAKHTTFNPYTLTIDLTGNVVALVSASRVDKASPAIVREASPPLTAILADRLDSLPRTDIVWTQDLAPEMPTFRDVYNAVSAMNVDGQLTRFQVQMASRGAIVGYREKIFPEKLWGWFKKQSVLDVVVLIATESVDPRGRDTHLPIRDILRLAKVPDKSPPYDNSIDWSLPTIGPLCIAFVYVTPQPQYWLSSPEYLAEAGLIFKDNHSGRGLNDICRPKQHP
jgi:hypothetical protein